MIKNIIFDLGGLFIDVYMDATRKKVEEYCGESTSEVEAKLLASGLFDAYETGAISTEVFLSHWQKELPTNVSFDLLVEAWNAVLGPVYVDRLEEVQALRDRYRIFLLSNTNDLHVQGFENWLEKHHGFRELTPYFEKVYYSQKLGLRKPNPAIFERVANENRLITSETLFIDDSPGHLIGAKQTGMMVFHHPGNTDIRLSLKQIGLLDH